MENIDGGTLAILVGAIGGSVVLINKLVDFIINNTGLRDTKFNGKYMPSNEIHAELNRIRDQLHVVDNRSIENSAQLAAHIIGQPRLLGQIDRLFDEISGIKEEIASLNKN